MGFTICTILLAAEVLSLGLTRRVVKSLHFLLAKGLETNSFLVALSLVAGFVLDWIKTYLTIWFTVRKMCDFLRCHFVLKQRKVLFVFSLYVMLILRMALH